ncbi:hypothetical protein [Helicobacter sp. MIT 14-3879]|nr:hypothetical protein [Helicobacter sp. MIT 14-3879]
MSFHKLLFYNIFVIFGKYLDFLNEEKEYSFNVRFNVLIIEAILSV